MSQFNNNADNQDPTHFRPVFFDTSKAVMTQGATTQAPESAHIKRARLDSTAGITAEPDATPLEGTAELDESKGEHMMDVDGATVNHDAMTIDAVISAVDTASNAPFDQGFKHHSHPTFVATPDCSTPSSHPMVEEKRSIQVKSSTLLNANKKGISKARVRKYRSKSLPNIIFGTHSNHSLYQKLNSDVSQKTASSAASARFATDLFQVPLPPVNIQSLREIDLSEILKNPQLRHDILFDPQLQFRPNLDGERGRRKKITYEKYWGGVKEEIRSLYSQETKFDASTSRLPVLFMTLREILLSLLPSKDKQGVYDVLDIELINQQLAAASLDFVALSQWLNTIFKSHCAPMRDNWVDEMSSKFNLAASSKSVTKLVEGLRMIFTILEAMKLDVANHQIRVLRPVLVETAVEFERDYFNQMIGRCKLDISDSVRWFKTHLSTLTSANSEFSPRQGTVSAVLSLLSCSKMVNEFPSSLAFDHSRLVVLRANIRQLVCLQICLVLYRQLVTQNNADAAMKAELLSSSKLNDLKREIMAIVSDDDGNVKWTRNITGIALQIARRSNPSSTDVPSESQVSFGFNWLIKQTQPSSQVYNLMEAKTFKSIAGKIDSTDSSFSNISSTEIKDLTSLIPVAGSENAISSTSLDVPSREEEEEDLNGVASRVGLLCKFHWNVFGSYYS